MSAKKQSNAPTLIAYQVTSTKDGEKAIWRKIGAPWPNKAGGFQLRLEAMPFGGQLVLLPPKARESQAAA
jgi:hypothetical protein